MIFRYFSALITFCCLMALPSRAQEQDTSTSMSRYREAERLFSLEAPTQRTDSLALQAYRQVAEALSPLPAYAKTVADAYLKAGILQQTYGEQQQAIQMYQKAVRIAQRHQLNNSQRFEPLLYTANAFYFLDELDSAIYYLDQAERIIDEEKEEEIAGADRLYNAFGAIYFEEGNYRQSINYFAKALSLAEARNTLSPEAAYSFQSNIASSLFNLNEFDSAIVIYKRLLQQAGDSDEIYINLATAFLESGRPDSALFYLERVQTRDDRQQLIMLNKKADAYLQKQQAEEAERELRAVLSRVEEDTALYASEQILGDTYHQLGQLYEWRRDYSRALSYYQRAIIRLSINFSDEDFRQSPEHHGEGFISFDLFEVLLDKAACLGAFYRQSREAEDLQACIATYESAFRMADYVSKSFDNDDARIFLAERSFPAYQEAVSLLLDVYEEQSRQPYLEKAWIWSEKSKASTLAMGLKENRIRNFSGLPDSLLRRERNLKQELSRLFIRLGQAEAAETRRTLEAAIRDTELSLSRLRDKLDEFPQYYRKMYQYDSLDINFLREEVLDEQTALLSYFFTGDGLALFILRQKSMDYHHLNWQGHNSQQLDSLLKALSRIEAGAAYQGRKAASRLYDALFAPALPLLEDISSLIIIPHLSLNQLPFEVLTSGPGDYLLRDYVIGYQFAATFLQDQAGKEGEPDRWLAVAPFASAGSWGNFSDLRSLPSSGEEIAGLNARQLLNREATKSVFLQEAERASLIHLATHAVANSAEPLRSYIAFYPENEEESGYRLYAHELYNLSLRGSGLAFLSACETSGGSLQGSEGIMSLSRAFAYAGCPALITSLWRAEDHATAYLSRRFYQHVEEGRHFPEALRLAKLDLLDDPAMAQFRTPAYWAHLVFIGRGDTEAEKGWPWWGLPLSGLMLIVVLMIWLRPWRINAGAR